MKAGPIEVGRLLQNRQRFCVPIYQRHYVWTRQKRWEPFWNDIRTKAIECLAGRERRFSHFMGAVVLEARGGFSAGRVPAFQVVDGQQRLTTFQVFLAAAKDYAVLAGFRKSAEQITDYLINDKPHLMEDKGVETYKVWPTQYDRAMFIDIITLGRKALRQKYLDHFYATRDKIYEYKTTPNLLGAYGYFFDRIKHAVETDDLDDEFIDTQSEDVADKSSDDAVLNDNQRETKLDTIWQALVEEFKVVEIVLEEGDDAQVIFETLNERGEPLLAADLVRNNIFHRADAAGQKVEQLFTEHWKAFEAPFWSAEEKQGRYKKPRIEFFLANFIAGRIAGEVNLGKLFSEYKAFLRPKGSKEPRYPSVIDEVKELARLGSIYRELIERTSGSELASFSRRLLPWDVSTVYPLVMRVWACDVMSAEQKGHCLRMLLSFIVRRAVCGLTTKNYNKFFLMTVSHLDRTAWSPNALAEFLMTQKQESGRIPRDNEFEQKWTTAPSYRDLQPARTRAILEEIELSKRTSFHETNELSANLSVEHVMPTGWREHWPMMDGHKPTETEFFASAFSAIEDSGLTGRIVRRNRLKDNFGNLTLLTQPLNNSVSNGLFAAKKIAIDEHSLLVLNRELKKYNKRDEEVITERSNTLLAVAKQIWPLPSSTT